MGGLKRAGPEIWAGPECSYLTVGDRSLDQLALTGHADRSTDLDSIAALRVSAVRYPVLFGRTDEPGQLTDWAWADERIGGLTERGIRPIVGLLHHGFGRAGVDPLDAAWPEAVGRYAREVALRYPAVSAFLPLNEPLTTARFGALYGWWPPHVRDHDVFVRLVLAEAQAFQEAARAIRDVRGEVQILLNEDVGRTFGTEPCRSAVEHDNERRWLTFDLACGRVEPGHPLWRYLARTPALRRVLDQLRLEPEPPDVLGINHYVTSDRFLDHRLERYPTHTHGGDGRTAYADVELVRVAGSEPDGFARPLRETSERYARPVALTEVHLAGEAADQEAWWWAAWSAALDAIGDGIHVQAVTAWAAFGAVDWDSLLREPRGSYVPGCFDIRDGGPRLTRLGRAVAATAAGARPVPQTGWWTRDDRLLYGEDDRPRVA